ncbi:MAG: hypothetical protein ACJ76L_10260 [Conexibacter sp.]
MRSRRYRIVVAAVVAAMAVMVGAGAAQAVFPNFSGCTLRNPDFGGNAEDGACVNVQQRSGNLRIKNFNVPLHETLEIRGILVPNGTTTPTFRAPTGSTGFIGKPERVPGGLLGIEWLPGNSVLAITELAGSPSDIRLSLTDFSIRIPIKMRLVNLLLGMDCHIGTNSRPVMLNLITETTSPPAPNTPISGRVGTISELPGGGLQAIGNVNVENSFAVPGATECGFGLGLINSLVNLRLGLPSAAGNNSGEIRSDVAIGYVP